MSCLRRTSSQVQAATNESGNGLLSELAVARVPNVRIRAWVIAGVPAAAKLTTVTRDVSAQLACGVIGVVPGSISQDEIKERSRSEFLVGRGIGQFKLSLQPKKPVGFV